MYMSWLRRRLKLCVDMPTEWLTVTATALEVRTDNVAADFGLGPSVVMTFDASPRVGVHGAGFVRASTLGAAGLVLASTCVTIPTTYSWTPAVWSTLYPRDEHRHA